MAPTKVYITICESLEISYLKKVFIDKKDTILANLKQRAALHEDKQR